MGVLHRYVQKGEVNFVHLQISNEQKKIQHLWYRLSITSSKKDAHRIIRGRVILSPSQVKNLIFPVVLLKTGKYSIETTVSDGKIAIPSETRRNDYFYVVDLAYKKSKNTIFNKSNIEFPITLFAENKVLKRMLHPKEKFVAGARFKYLSYGANIVMEL